MERAAGQMDFHKTFAEFAREYSGMAKEQFLTQFNVPFLLIDFEGVVAPPKSMETTMPPPRLNAMTQFSPGHDEKQDKVVVAPLLKSDRNDMAGVITLGRADKNDIVLPHGVISKLHAVFRKDPSTGHYSVTDAKSKYGTFVDEKQLVPMEPFMLTKKTTILFARYVQAMFFPPREFHQHMHLMLHRGQEK